MSHEYKVGDRVRYLNARTHRTDPEYYPEVGTVGEVIAVEKSIILVQWPKGTTAGHGRWWQLIGSVEPVTE